MRNPLHLELARKLRGVLLSVASLRIFDICISVITFRTISSWFVSALHDNFKTYCVTEGRSP